MSTESYSFIRKLAQERGVDPDLAEAVLHQESRGKASAVSPKGARGLMQTMPTTLTDPGFGVKPAQNDTPEELARVGVDYLGAMLKRYGGNVGSALSAYNAGPARADKYGANVPIPETRMYVAKVTKDFMRRKNKGRVSSPPPEDPFAGLDDFGDESKQTKPLPKRTTSLAEMALDAVIPAVEAGDIDQFEGLADFEDANGANAKEFDDPLDSDGGVEGQFDNVDIADDGDPFAGLDDFGTSPTGPESAPKEPKGAEASDEIAPPDVEFSPSVMSKLPTDIEGSARALGFDPTKFPEKGSIAERMLTPYEMATEDTFKGALGRVGYGTVKTIDNFGNLLAMGADKLIGLDPKTKYYMQFLQAYRDAQYKQARHSEGSAPSEFDPFALAGSVVVPVPTGKMNAVSTLGKMAQGAKLGAVAGTMYGDAELGDDYWAQKALGSGIGALAGGSLSGLAQGGKYVTNKGVNAVTGTMTDEASRLQHMADEAKMPLLATDAMADNKITNTMSAVMNALPVVGTKGVRKEQTRALGERAQQLADEAESTAKSMNYDKVKGFATASKDASSRAGVSKKIMKEAGDDLGKIVSASADYMTTKELAQADKLYSKVRELAKSANVSTDYANMAKALDEQITQLKTSKFQDNTLFDALKFASDKIQRNPNMGMDDLLETRTTVATLLDKANNTALFTHGPQAVRALSAVKEGLDADIAIATGGPKTKLGKALAQADEFERVVVRGREGAKLTSALAMAKDTGDYDEVANLVMRPHLVDRVAKSASLLDSKGKQALLASIMKRGVEQSYISGTGEFSPKTMAVFLSKNAKALSTLGGPDYTRQVEGYKRLLLHMNSKTHEDKMTLGSTAIATGTGAGIGLYSTSALSNPTFWAGAIGMGLLFRTEAGKRILLASSKTPIKSDRMNELINQLGQQAVKAGVLTTTQQGIN